MRFILGKAAVKRIHAAVEALFGRAKQRLFGGKYEPKTIVFTTKPASYRPDLSLPGIFDAASHAEGMKPNIDLRDSLNRVAEQYLDARRELAKAHVVHAVQSFLSDAETKGINTDVQTVLGGELTQMMGHVTRDVKRIVETESTRARNVGTLDAITKVSIMAGVSDPVIFFVTIRDLHRCEECTKMHILPDGITPRVWLLSEVGHGYHKRGDSNPKIGDLHPNGRCTMTILMPGYGFDAAGKVTYIDPSHDEFKKQRG